MSYNHSMLIDYDGNVGFGITPTYPLQMASGAHVSAGGVWVNASSREYKDNITPLSCDEAAMALEGLKPVSFTYKADPEESHLGFIAEEVPEILATKDRKGMSPLDVVAVLTKVVQEKSKLIDQQKKAVQQLQTTIQGLQQLLEALAEQVQQLTAEVSGRKIMGKQTQVLCVR